MKIIEKEASEIAEILKASLGKEDTFFVFASSVELETWSTWCVKNPQKSGTNVISMQQFIAWDKFKENYLATNIQGKQAIPSILKKLFVYDLIEKNSQLAQKNEAIFKSIINPNFAQNSFSFTDWISSNLSSLDLWHKHYLEWLSKNHKTPQDDSDLENQDYLKLYEMYKKFLGDKMFEPSWLSPQFLERKKTFIIFYPEQMQDFDEYKNIFKDAQNIISVQLPQNENSVPEIYSYPDARMELRRTVLKIRELIDDSKSDTKSDSQNSVKPQDIAVHVPELSTYIPYISREFQKYCVPFVIRASSPVLQNSAGSIFENIQECYKQNFSYDSVRALLLNDYVPWKEKKINENLIKEGNAHHCLCNYDKNSDVWLEVLSSIPTDQLELQMYKNLKNHITKICTASSFSDLLKFWFEFRNEFLKTDFSESADQILSTCIKELQKLVSAENDFFEEKNLHIVRPFDFFMNELKNKTYRPQEKINGVSIFVYKLAAISPYKYNFVINCSQNAINITYKPLSFLNSLKRKELNFFDDEKPSSAFIRLYEKSSEIKTFFSYSEESFSGFQIPHNYFEEAPLEKNHTPFDELDKKDFILNEKKYFLNNEDFDCVSKNQIQEFKIWQSKNSLNPNQKNISDDFKKLIKIPTDFVLKTNRSGNGIPDENLKDIFYEREKIFKNQNLIKITQSDMSSFFTCPRQWFFKSVLKLKDDTLDLSLFDNYVKGDINHKILELLFKNLKVLPTFVQDFGAQEDEIKTLVQNSVLKAFEKFQDSPISYKILLSQKNKFFNGIMNFLKNFCAPEKYASYTVVNTESWLCSQDEQKDFALSGRIDCVLSSPLGKLTIIDYKNSKLPSIKECTLDDEGNISNFQCVLYVQLWNFKNKINPVEKMSFVAIQSDKESTIFDSDSKKTFDSYKSTVEEAKLYEDYFYQKAKDYDFKAIVQSKNKFCKLNIFSDCIKCNFKAICRTSFTAGEKKL